MSNLIHILPPQLANQIAAGEVVERPASVVKELVENSLDAGANLIQIEIEKGGAQLIRIRDNGCGIGKDDLALALARHATSKIASLEDLEAILSLGFRGEALASISSVSRLTLTSRTAAQTEAWKAYAQGREMAVEIQPASHPVGTTIEVANLFFNTPARRKFLRTDKTEFAHIDEVVRRIALAKPTVSFILSHNDKKVRQYKAANQTVEQQQKRVAAICGEEFITHANHIDWQHGDLHLHGWVGLPSLARTQNDLCYSYVNGRMMRDKTINHAIRQAYGEHLLKEHYPAFVLFLELSPGLVDVNVHPAKHEVRFHQGRLVHDFILQGVSNALQTQGEQCFLDGVSEPSPIYQVHANRASAGSNVFNEPQQAVKNQQRFAGGMSAPKQTSVSRSAQKWYGELIGRQFDESAPAIQEKGESIIVPARSPENLSATCESSKDAPSFVQTDLMQAIAVVKNQALLLKQRDDFYLISLNKLAELKFQAVLNQAETQALLIPLNLTLDTTQSALWQAKADAFAAMGFEFQVKQFQGQERITLLGVPKILREQNLQQLILGALTADDLVGYFAKHRPFLTACTLAQAVTLLAEVEQYGKLTELNALKVPIDFDSWLAKCG